MDETLKDEIRRLSEQRAEEELGGPVATSQPFPCQLLLGKVHHLEHLRQQLEDVQSTVESLDHFLATLRNIKAEIPMLLANQDPNKQKNETDQEKETHYWWATTERLKPAVDQSHNVDCSLKAVGITLTMNGASVTCGEMVDYVSKQMRARRQEGEKELDLLEKNNIQSSDNINLKEAPRNDSAKRDCEQSAPSVTEEESMLEVKKKKQGDNESKMEKGQGKKIQTLRSEEGLVKPKFQRQKSTSSYGGRGEDELQSLVQRKCALLAVLRETKAKAEELELLELTLPALQQRCNTNLVLSTHFDVI